MTDQQRGDCLGIENHPVLQTPHLDYLASSGIRFRHAYSACPICIPARRTLMSGQKPSTHGVTRNFDTELKAPTLPGELSKAGYQTHLVGKLHLYPRRKLYGFGSSDWADGHSPSNPPSDYDRFLQQQAPYAPRAGIAHGMGGNAWTTRPFHMEERLHFTNWCTDMAMQFLERRDPTVPFFLKVSYHQPHQPCTPPQVYYDRYMNMDLPEPVVGDWAKLYDAPVRGLPTDSWRISIDAQQMKQYRAAYYGCINHIDDQIGRLLSVVPANTVVLFCSDHGEMLGDHQWTRKMNAFEASARVPFLIRFPKEMGIRQGDVRDEAVELMDVMPTLLDAAGVPIPDSVDGSSVLRLLRGATEWREYVHGECASIPTLNSGMQYVTDGRRKYIYYPGTGAEQYFNLEEDPQEMYELSGEPGYAEEIAKWRSRLVKEQAGRADADALSPIRVRK
jgi:arylsulfatase A-like enzyme